MIYLYYYTSDKNNCAQNEVLRSYLRVRGQYFLVFSGNYVHYHMNRKTLNFNNVYCIRTIVPTQVKGGVA